MRMKTIKTKKLSLDRSTARVLAHEHLKGIAGGGTFSCGGSCGCGPIPGSNNSCDICYEN